MNPILKWPGGKRTVAKDILGLLPAGKRLVEPFVGSAAVSLASEGYKSMWWNDAASKLYWAYVELKNNPESVYNELMGLVQRGVNEDTYYKIRDEFNDDDRFNLLGGRAARLIFLNKTCFNGIYRENLFGDFNVPWGKRFKPSLPSKDDVLAFGKVLHKVKLTRWDFIQVMRGCKPGDVCSN